MNDNYAGRIARALEEQNNLLDKQNDLLREIIGQLSNLEAL